MILKNFTENLLTFLFFYLLFSIEDQKLKNHTLDKIGKKSENFWSLLSEHPLIENGKYYIYDNRR